MKRLPTILFAVVCFAFAISSAFADQYVRGYTRNNGTVVQPYYRSSLNNTVTDNFSFRGNTNPYTGKAGQNDYIHDKTSPYYQGPDSHGLVGHSGAPGPSESYRVPVAIDLCPSPHFIMTEADGCQPAARKK